ncbi:MAG: hypothetical protein DMG65_01495 [Candidatus Angelobacter sp. Gp1-AA117]|nr:MAG: hypothetical protein DMG65_01495 [Candidatus Angelobacter sp. Gp1-AA117]
MGQSFVWTESAVASGRITIGQDLVRELSWLTGSGHIEARILTLEPGRYRIIPNSAFETNEELKEILERFSTLSSTFQTVLETDSPEFAVLPSRLLQVSISPPPSSWRLNLSSIPLLDATGEEIQRVILVVRKDCIEMWSALRFAHAQSVPLERLLR